MLSGLYFFMSSMTSDREDATSMLINSISFPDTSFHAFTRSSGVAIGVSDCVPSSSSIFLRRRLSTMTTRWPCSERWRAVGHPQKPSPPRTRDTGDPSPPLAAAALTRADLRGPSIMRRSSAAAIHPFISLWSCFKAGDLVVEAVTSIVCGDILTRDIRPGAILTAARRCIAKESPSGFSEGVRVNVNTIRAIAAASPIIAFIVSPGAIFADTVYPTRRPRTRIKDKKRK
mmetsp:Transcript_24/g.50  ORF Transcript_24/g.50 Transcript_24/m.50 type:complete len:230 (+) Transcript_24:1071-1760(+)